MSLRSEIPFSASLLWLMVSGIIPSAQAQFTPQGGPLSFMNGGVAISENGNTAIIGDFGHNNSTGGVLIFTRSNGVWSQQGTELVGSGPVPSEGSVYQGSAVAISADGNTALVGGPFDGGDSRGAVWVFTRSNGLWTQQGPKLVANGAVSDMLLGDVVALSADGNTALVGTGGVDGAYVFTRSNGVWSQQGGKLTGTVTGCFDAVALSADGNTALVGNYCDDPVGAGLVFTRSGGVWSQQGRLVGTGAVGNAFQGISVALSSDGNTAIVGGYFDNNFAGAVWVFTRSNGQWNQQGAKLTVTDAVGPDATHFGESAALSGDGNTALITGPADNNYTGATWVLRRSNGVWTEQSKLIAQNAGNLVAISTDGSTAILGDIQARVFAQPRFTFLTPATATGGGPFNFIVSALDANNLLAANYSGTLHFTSSDVAATLPADTTLSAGLRNVTATLRMGGNQFFTATDTVNASITGTSGAIMVSSVSAFPLIAVYRPAGALAVWAFDSNGNYGYDTSDRSRFFGLAGDQPVAGDWTGNGQVRIGVFRNGLWYLDLNNNGQWDGVAGGDGIFAFGLPGDTAVFGNWNGDGRTKLGVFRCPQVGTCTWVLDYAGKFAYDPPTAKSYSYGLPGDTPVVNNWNGTSNIDQIGVYRPLPNGLSLWIVDSNGSGAWEPTDATYQFGLATDIPVVANWNNAGRKRIGVFRNGMWVLDTNGNNAYDGTDAVAFFGLLGDKPMVGNWSIP